MKDGTREKVKARGIDKKTINAKIKALKAETKKKKAAK